MQSLAGKPNTSNLCAAMPEFSTSQQLRLYDHTLMSVSTSKCGPYGVDRTVSVDSVDTPQTSWRMPDASSDFWANSITANRLWNWQGEWCSPVAPYDRASLAFRVRWASRFEYLGIEHPVLSITAITAIHHGREAEDRRRQKIQKIMRHSNRRTRSA